MGIALAENKTLPLSPLAKTICKVLLDVSSTPDIVCPDTGIVFSGSTDYDVAEKINKNACGVHYTALGFHYVLCYEPKVQEIFVAVHKEKDSSLVGVVFYDHAERIELHNEFKAV